MDRYTDTNAIIAAWTEYIEANAYDEHPREYDLELMLLEHVNWSNGAPEIDFDEDQTWEVLSGYRYSYQVIATMRDGSTEYRWLSFDDDLAYWEGIAWDEDKIETMDSIRCNAVTFLDRLLDMAHRGGAIKIGARATLGV